jgi:hypothetical protein
MSLLFKKGKKNPIKKNCMHLLLTIFCVRYKKEYEQKSEKFSSIHPSIHPSLFSPGWPKAMNRSHLGCGVLEMPN